VVLVGIGDAAELSVAGWRDAAAAFATAARGQGSLALRLQGSPSGRLALVGKGIMYDSGGLGIKPNDRVHAQMKNDMSGAAAVFASMLVLRELGCPPR
jgi:leucyl aminopeptidase